MVDSLVVGPICTGQAVKSQRGEWLTGRAMWSRSQPQGPARASAISTEANVEWRRALERPSGDPCPLPRYAVSRSPSLPQPWGSCSGGEKDPTWMRALLPAGGPPDAGPERWSPPRLSSDRLRCPSGSLPVRTAWLQTAWRLHSGHLDPHGQTFSQAHDPRAAGRGAAVGCSIRYPLCSMQGTGLLGIPAEPPFWVRICLAASRPGGESRSRGGMTAITMPQT